MRFSKCSVWVAVFCTLLAACRKDVLRWNAAERIAAGPQVRWNRVAVLGDTLWVVAGGEKFSRADVLISRDAGATWTHHGFPEIGKGIYGLSLSTRGHLLACGFTSTLLQSEDGGRHWTTGQAPEEAYYVAATTLGAGRRLLLSTVTYERGSIRVLDALNAPIKNHSFLLGLSDVGTADSLHAYAAGYGAVLKTVDGGITWHHTPADGDHFVALDVHGLDTVYVCGNTGSILRTTNGGSSWRRLRSTGRYDQPFYALQDIVFTDPQHGYCVGEDGLVIHTDDAGSHWMEYERFTSAHLRSLAVLPGGDLLVCGDGGALWRLKVQ